MLRLNSRDAGFAEAFRRLVHETWRTAGGGRTDEEGRVGARAFHGRYEVTVTRDGAAQTVQIDHEPSETPTRVRVRF